MPKGKKAKKKSPRRLRTQTDTSRLPERPLPTPPRSSRHRPLPTHSTSTNRRRLPAIPHREGESPAEYAERNQEIMDYM